MQVSPTDIQAWAAATGAEYPATPAEKAAVLPQVAAWKAQNQASARESRGQNAISPLAVGAGAAGLGLAGLLAFNHFKRQGLSDPAAAQYAKNAENQATATRTAVAAPPAAPPAEPPTPAPAPAGPATAYRTVDPQSQAVRSRPDSFTGPRLRADEEDAGRNPQAATLETRAGRSLGATLAREQGQYKARTEDGYHNPALQGLDTPEKREVFLAGVADTHGTNSTQFQDAQALIASLETTTGSGVDPQSFIAGLNPEQRFGTSTAEEMATRGGDLSQSRTKANASAQAGFRSPEGQAQAKAKVYSPQARANQQADALAEAIATPGPGDMGATAANKGLGSVQADNPYGTRTDLETVNPEVYRQLASLDTGKGNIEAPKATAARKPLSLDPKEASVFFLDVDGSYKPYMGSSPVIGKGNVILSTGRRADGSPIAETDLAYFPTDDTKFYERSSISHPFLDLQSTEEEPRSIEANASARPDLRFADTEDQGIKGMQESLPSLGARIATGKSTTAFARQGITNDGVSDNWTFGRVAAGGDRLPLDVSGFQSEMESPAFAAGGRLKQAMDDHLARSGRPVPEPVAIQWATSLAQKHGSDPASVLRVALGVKPRAAQPAPRSSARALAAGTGDALDRVYTSLGMHAGANTWDLEGMVRSGDLKGAAAALASQLPALTATNSSGLRGIGQDEKLNIVAEAVSAGIKDLSIAVEKYPEAAAKFGIGSGSGGFGIDAYLKSYARDWVTVRGLQLDTTGQPTYQVPNDAFEILAHQASQNGHSTLHEIEQHIRGSANGLEGALRLDRLVSGAQSTKANDPNTNGTNFAQLVFDLKDQDLVSTQLTADAASDVKLSFGTRRNYDATAGFYDRNPNESQLGEANDDYRALRRGKEKVEQIRNTDGSTSFQFTGEMVDGMADAIAPYGLNSTLTARYKGADFKTPEGQAIREASETTQKWITANATQLERDRADLNRGIINLDGIPRSIGRGIVISSDQHGAFLAGDTQGMNTSVREEQFDVEDATPVAEKQEWQQEDKTHNLLAEPDGIDVPVTEEERQRRIGKAERDYYAAGSRRGDDADRWNAAASTSLPRLIPSVADAVTQQYSDPKSKVKFKNLGSFDPNDLGQLNKYTAKLGRENAILADTRAAMAAGHVTLPGLGNVSRLFGGPNTGVGWQPEPGHGIDIGASSPVRGMGPRPAPPAAPITLQSPPEHRPTPAMTENGQASIDLDRRTLQHSTQAPYATVMPKGWAPNFNDPVIQAGLDVTPRAELVTTGNEQTARRQTEALAARGVGRGKVFRDDQNLRDAQAFSSGYIERAKQANAAASAAALEQARTPEGLSSPEDRSGVGGAQGIALEPATPRQSGGSQFDTGELSGIGRRGSTFAQEPIRSAPESRVSPDVQVVLNTLNPAGRSASVPSITDHERRVAEVGHHADYLDKLYSAGLTADAKPAARGSNRPTEYRAPGEALLAARVNMLRKRGIL